jgi:hypothetical protein
MNEWGKNKRWQFLDHDFYDSQEICFQCSQLRLLPVVGVALLRQRQSLNAVNADECRLNVRFRSRHPSSLHLNGSFQWHLHAVN